MTYADVLAEAWQQHQAPRAADAPTVISTFAGGGGSSLGYSMAGYRELLAVEWEDHAAECLRRNLHTQVFHGDISHVTADIIDLAPGELDVLDGSPPCQGFSRANTQSVAAVTGNDPRNHLFLQFARLIALWQPKVFVMENVPSMAEGKHIGTFRDVCTTLRTVGPRYRIHAKVLIASALGVPQRRRRLIMVGTRSDLGIDPELAFPQPLNTPPVTLRQAVVGVEGHGKRLNPGKGKTPQMYPHIKPGGALSDVLAAAGKKPSFFSLRRMQWDRPTNTVLKSVTPIMGLLHPREHRHLTSAELCRVSSFPDEYAWGNSTYQQIHARLGNSVPPLMMRAVARQIRHQILEPSRAINPT